MATQPLWNISKKQSGRFEHLHWMTSEIKNQNGRFGFKIFADSLSKDSLSVTPPKVLKQAASLTMVAKQELLSAS